MVFIAPDILPDVHPLHPGLLVTGLAAGLLWWARGAWAHRLWLVLFCTAGFGILGLVWGPVFEVQPLVLGLLMAVSAGFLAVHLIRPAVFLSGGVTAWIVAHALVPAWDEPFVGFFAGGLLALALFRLWVTLATSLAGTVVATYCVLGLLHKYAKVDSVAWAAKQGPLLNCVVAGVTVLGVLTQFYLARRAAQRKTVEEAAERVRRDEEELRRLTEAARAQAKQTRAKPPKRWWESLPVFRKAG